MLKVVYSIQPKQLSWWLDIYMCIGCLWRRIMVNSLSLLCIYIYIYQFVVVYIARYHTPHQTKSFRKTKHCGWQPTNCGFVHGSYAKEVVPLSDLFMLAYVHEIQHGQWKSPTLNSHLAKFHMNRTSKRLPNGCFRSHGGTPKSSILQI